MTVLLLGVVHSSCPEAFVDDRIGIPVFSLREVHVFAISLGWTLS